MKFELKHTFDAPVDAVIAAMFDPKLFDHLKANMKTIQAIDPIERTEDDGTIRRRTRYTPVPLIKKIGPKQVPPGAMAFVEDSRFDKRARRLEFENIPDMSTLRKLLVNRGTISFRDAGGGRSERTVEGELVVKVFLIGKLAEKIIYNEAEKILNEEASALHSFIKARG
jgi:Protein of unknown function (DUF2505)